MAKILKIKVGRTLHGAASHYNYPSEYDANKIEVVAYEHFQVQERMDEVIARGGAYIYCIGVVEDINAAAFLKSDDITELTTEEAETLGTTYIRQVKKITDADIVVSVIEKFSKSIVLTPEEEKAIDPNDDSTKGITLSKSFVTKLSEAKARAI